jgi:tRNA(Ile)-lysidine synthase
MLRGGRLSGIAAVRGAIVRPLLDQSGAELRDWLHAHAIPWREDPTNADVRLERNWIRSVLLPLLRERREGVTSVLARIAEHSRADDDVLDGLASELFERAAVDDVGVLFPASDFDPLPPALRTRLVRSALRSIGADPSWTDLDAIAQLRSGRRVRCGAATVWRSNECIAFTRAPLAIPGPLELPAEGIAELPAWGIRVRVGRASASPWTWRTALPEGSPTIVRSRRTGDRVRTQVGTRKVQDVLVDAKVPSSLRDLVPIIAVGEDALAVVGLTAYPVASSTVVDVEPCSASWSRKVLWTRASA